MRSVTLGLLLAATLLVVSSAARQQETFTGVITDSECGKDGHAAMQMGPTDADCTRLCVMIHDARYVLFDGDEVFELSDQQTPYELAGQRVRVVGTLDRQTMIIQVDSISAVD